MGKSDSATAPNFKSGGKNKSKSKMYYQKQTRGRWNNRGGGKSDSSQKTGYKRPSKLDFGMKGFLCTTNLNEKNAVKEAYNLLNEYHDDNDELIESSGQLSSSSSGIKESGTSQSSMKGGSGGLEEAKDDSGGASVSLDEPKADTAGENKSIHKKISEKSDDDDDVESAIAQEISRLKSSEVKYKFQSVDTGVPNLIFINTTIGDPVKLTTKILQDLYEKKEQKCRFLLRMLPIEITCRADMADIKKTAELILPKYFKTGFNSFQVVYKSRYNNSMERGEVIKTIADVVMQINSFNSVNLNEPKLSIVVEIMRGLCCLGVLPKFVDYRKYNLIEVTSVGKSETHAEKQTTESVQSGLKVEQSKSEVKSDTAIDKEVVEKTDETMDCNSTPHDES